MLDALLDFSFLSKAASFSIPDIVSALAISFALGLFIFTVYKKTFSGVMYSSSFGITLVAMNLITCLVILAVSSNLITSLGMVGALSIIRFRTVIKEPLDLVYLFWSITTGIIVGVGLIPLAIIGAVAIGFMLFFFVNKKPSDTPYVLIINCANEDSESAAMAHIKGTTKKHLIKSKSVSGNGIELTVEVRLLEASTQFVNALLDLQGISNAALVSYNGDYYM